MKTVITHIIGGLGNQLFQYAAGMASAERNSAGLRLDTQDYSWYRRPYALNSFQISAANASWWEHVQLVILTRMGNRKSVRRDPGGYRYNPELLDMAEQQKIFLTGHWQNEKYFRDIRSRLLNEFRLKPEFSPLDSPISRAITDSESVAVHVRRGDNIEKPDPGDLTKTVPQLGMVSEHYIVEAMKHIKELHPGARFFIFSDEISWVRKNMPLPFPAEFIEDFSDVQQFELMSYCKHQIIANSTYSWWAAWLNNNPVKIVCAPKRWDVRDPAYDTRGLLPVSWTIIE